MRTEKNKAEIVSVVLLALATCFFNCAKEGMPPGGPEDATPPKVVDISPATGSTKVPLDSKIHISFSERMTPQITEESIFISPLPKELFEFGWKGKKLTLSLAEPLHPEMTYVVSVGADAQDLRRNRLGQTYTFAFSTGNKLDFGSISGQVWIRQKTGFRKEMSVNVWAYLLNEIESDVNPEIRKPDYITQTDDKGIYLFKNLRLGTYRLFAVQDIDRDLIWNWEKEPIGVTTQDLMLTEQDISFSDVNFVLDKKDKRNPSLLNCQSLNRNLLKLEFDEEPDQVSALNPENYDISSVDTHTFVKINSAFFADKDSLRIMLLTEQTNPHERYELSVLGIKDKAGNLVDSLAGSCTFTGSETLDTTGPTITMIHPEDGKVSVPFNSNVTITFNKPPDHRTIESSFSLLDSENITIHGKGEWISPNTYLFSPDSPLAKDMNFRVNLMVEKIRDELGNFTSMDSVFTSSFVTLNPDTLGSVSGQVDIEGKSGVVSAILMLWHLQQKEVSYQLKLTQPGPFRFDAVLPGKYFMAASLDLNQDGLLSPGEVTPFSPLEPFEVYPDTIHVRPRWETESINLMLQTH